MYDFPGFGKYFHFTCYNADRTVITENPLCYTFSGIINPRMKGEMAENISCRFI